MSGSRFDLAIIGRRSDVHVEGVGPIEIEVGIDATNVRVPECQSLIGLELEGALGVLPEAVQGGPGFRERGGKLEVLVLEDEDGGRVRGVWGGVENDVVGGAAGDGEAERGSVVERENEVVYRDGMGGFLWSLAGENVWWDFPSLVI